MGAPREKAVKNFVAVVCDKEIANITRDNLLDFCTLWLDRIDAGEVSANSANKDLIHLGDVSDGRQRGLTFGGNPFASNERQQRSINMCRLYFLFALTPGTIDGKACATTSGKQNSSALLV